MTELGRLSDFNGLLFEDSLNREKVDDYVSILAQFRPELATGYVYTKKRVQKYSFSTQNYAAGRPVQLDLAVVSISKETRPHMSVVMTGISDTADRIENTIKLLQSRGARNVGYRIENIDQQLHTLSAINFGK